MPISVERILRLVDAAETFRRRDRRWRDFMSDILAQVGSGHISAQQALEDIRVQLMVTTPYDRAELIIHEEKMKTALSYKRNVVERERLRQHRRGNYDWSSKDIRKPDAPILAPPIIEDDDNLITDEDMANWDINDPLAGETEEHKAEVEKVKEMLRKAREAENKD